MTKITCEHLKEGYNEYGTFCLCTKTNQQCNYQAHILFYGNGSLEACKNYEPLEICSICNGRFNECECDLMSMSNHP